MLSAMGVVMLMNQRRRQNLLSNNVIIMAGVHLEGAVVGPKIDGAGYARHTAFIDLAHM
jgi:hypothetical protein